MVFCTIHNLWCEGVWSDAPVYGLPVDGGPCIKVDGSMTYPCPRLGDGIHLFNDYARTE